MTCAVGFQVARFAVFVLAGSSWLAVRGYAQSPSAPLETAAAPLKASRQNVLHLDLLAPLIANAGHRMNGSKGLAFPVLVSYERHLVGRISVGAEALVWGGSFEKRRSGAALLGRWYALPVNWPGKELQGLYISPVVSYRALRTTAGGFNRPVNSGKRAGAGVLVG